MTSTNDGKDVKSNQTSGQKGKAYYIELYKSLEAQLSSECELPERTQQLGEAWRRIHSLCQHSAPSTHEHLLNWLQRHTVRTVLQTKWTSSKDDQDVLDQAIQSFIDESAEAAATRAGPSPPWVAHLRARGAWLRRLLRNPWGHPVLDRLLNATGAPPSDEEVLEWLKEERGSTVVFRLRQLASSRQLADLALRLASAVLSRARVLDTAPVAEQTLEQKETPAFGNAFAETLRTEADFTDDVWLLIADIEFVLLYKLDKRERCIELAKAMGLRDGCSLVDRLASRLAAAPHERKIWKHGKDVAILVAQMIITRCMVTPVCAGVVRSSLQRCTAALTRLLAGERLAGAAAQLAAPAASARHLHALAHAVHATSTDDMKPFICELYIRAITAGMNELESARASAEKESEARSTEQTLASWFLSLGELLGASERVQCECRLTAFSVHPSPAMYDKIKMAPAFAPVAAEIQEPNPGTASEFGSWASDSRAQTNFVKTSETLNLKRGLQRADVLSTAMFAEGEALGLSQDLCQDLAVLLAGPRVKTLSWDMDRELLLESCRGHMERTHGGTRALTTELKYLNLDPSAFQHLPEEEEDDTDQFYGIEKGYEHLVEFQEPEEIWEDPEGTESAWTSGGDEVEGARRKKKKKKPLPVLDCNLSLVAETKRVEKKERPHSKERSKERKKKPVDPLSKEPALPPDPLAPDETKEKKKKPRKPKEPKEKKERKKKEKKNKEVGTSLSQLVGMKVAKIEDDNISGVAVSDSDYDQGRYSIHSQGNGADVRFDGLFSMDELKSPERTPKVQVKKRVAHPAKRVVMRPSISSSPLTFSDESRNSPQMRVQGISNDVKRSLSKLLQEKRQGSDSSMEQHRHPSMHSAFPGRQTPKPEPYSPKTVEIPDIPKTFIHKKMADHALSIAAHYQHYGLPLPANMYMPHDGESQAKDALQIKDIVRMTSQDRHLHNPIQQSILKSSLNRDSDNQKSFQNFIQGLKQTVNAGIDKLPPRPPTAKKEIKPVSRVTPVKPATKVEPKLTSAKTQVQQKKIENPLNTFSRLSYMHKNYKEITKPKPTDANLCTQSAQNRELDRMASELKEIKMNYLKGKGEVSILRAEKPKVKCETATNRSVSSKDHPVLSNMLQHKPVSEPPRYLEKGHDALHLLRQQAKLNQLFQVQDLSTKYNANTTGSNYSQTVQSHQTDATPALIAPSFNPERPKAKSSLYKIEGDVRTEVKGPNKPGWESVMSALLATKTPKRGPNALDMTLNKKSFAQAFEESLLKQHQEHICFQESRRVKPRAPKDPSKSRAKSSTDSKRGNSKKPLDKKSNQTETQSLNVATPKTGNTFGSAETVPGSDYDILDELMDDDLRQEIGELLSDEESYNQIAPTVLDGINLEFENKVSENTPSNGPKTIQLRCVKPKQAAPKKSVIKTPKNNAPALKPKSGISKGKLIPSELNNLLQRQQQIKSENKLSTANKTDLATTPRPKVVEKMSDVLFRQSQVIKATIDKIENAVTPTYEDVYLKAPNVNAEKMCDVLLSQSQDIPKIESVAKPKPARIYKQHMPMNPKPVEIINNNLQSQPPSVIMNKKKIKASVIMPPKVDNMSTLSKPKVPQSAVKNTSTVLLNAKKIVLTPKAEVKQTVLDTKKVHPTLNNNSQTYSGHPSNIILTSKGHTQNMKVNPTIISNNLISGNNNNLAANKPASPTIIGNSVIASHRSSNTFVNNPVVSSIRNSSTSATNYASNITINSTPSVVTSHRIGNFSTGMGIPVLNNGVIATQDPTMTDYAANHRVITSNVPTQMSVIDTSNVYLNSMPQSIPKVVLVESAVVYDTYSSAQAAHTNINTIQNAFSAANAANLLYQTTQYAAPVVSPLIIGNAVSIIDNNHIVSSQSIPSYTTTEATSVLTQKPTSQTIYAAQTEPTNTQNIKAEKLIEAPEDISAEIERTILNLSANKSLGRKVLSEVQENHELVDNSERRFENSLRKDILADQERLRQKRLAIINREIYHRLDRPPIPLTYTPLITTAEGNSTAQVNLDSMLNIKVQNNVSEVNSATNSPNSCKENKTSSPICTIALRSSRKVSSKKLLSPLKSPKRAARVITKKGKRSRYVSKISESKATCRSSKRILDQKFKTNENEAENKDLEDLKDVQFKAKTTTQGPSKECNAEYADRSHALDDISMLDFEEELLGSKILKAPVLNSSNKFLITEGITGDDAINEDDTVDDAINDDNINDDSILEDNESTCPEEESPFIKEICISATISDKTETQEASNICPTVFKESKTEDFAEKLSKSLETLNDKPVVTKPLLKDNSLSLIDDEIITIQSLSKDPIVNNNNAVNKDTSITAIVTEKSIPKTLTNIQDESNILISEPVKCNYGTEALLKHIIPTTVRNEVIEIQKETEFICITNKETTPKNELEDNEIPVNSQNIICNDDITKKSTDIRPSVIDEKSNITDIIDKSDDTDDVILIDDHEGSDNTTTNETANGNVESIAFIDIGLPLKNVTETVNHKPATASFLVKNNTTALKNKAPKKTISNVIEKIVASNLPTKPVTHLNVNNINATITEPVTNMFSNTDNSMSESPIITNKTTIVNHTKVINLLNPDEDDNSSPNKVKENIQQHIPNSSSPYANIAKHQNYDKKISKTDKKESILSDKELLDAYKNEIILEDLPATGDSSVKCVRVKLPNGKTFKATVHGQMPVNFDTLFSNPDIKALLLDTLPTKKKYTLNIRQYCTANKVQTPINTHSNIETVDLLSDDEDTINKKFDTEFGKYKVESIDAYTFQKHQNMLKKKCTVRLKRVDENQQTMVSNDDQRKTVTMAPKTVQLLCNEVMSEILVTLNNAPPVSHHNKCKVPLNSVGVPEVIEIDDSSNDSVSVPVHENTKTLPFDEIQNLKRNVLLDFDTTVINKQKSPVKEIEKLKELLFEDFGVKGVTKNVDVTNVIISNKADDLIPEENRRATKKLKYYELLNENEHKQIFKQKCVIQLHRCDNLLKLLKSNLEEEITSQKVLDVDDAENSDIDQNERVALSKSGSFSILNDFSLYENAEFPKLLERDRSSPDIFELDRSSPVIEVFEVISTLHKKPLQRSHETTEKVSVYCQTDWFMTKPLLKFANLNSLNINNSEIIPALVNDFENLTDSKVKTNIPSLINILTKYLNVHGVIEQIYNLKRKHPDPDEDHDVLIIAKKITKCKSEIKYRYVENYKDVDRHIDDKINSVKKDTPIPKSFSLHDKPVIEMTRERNINDATVYTCRDNDDEITTNNLDFNVTEKKKDDITNSIIEDKITNRPEVHMDYSLNEIKKGLENTIKPSEGIERRVETIAAMGETINKLQEIIKNPCAENKYANNITIGITPIQLALNYNVVENKQEDSKSKIKDDILEKLDPETNVSDKMQDLEASEKDIKDSKTDTVQNDTSNSTEIDKINKNTEKFKTPDINNELHSDISTLGIDTMQNTKEVDQDVVCAKLSTESIKIEPTILRNAKEELETHTELSVPLIDITNVNITEQTHLVEMQTEDTCESIENQDVELINENEVNIPCGSLLKEDLKDIDFANDKISEPTHYHKIQTEDTCESIAVTNDVVLFNENEDDISYGSLLKEDIENIERETKELEHILHTESGTQKVRENNINGLTDSINKTCKEKVTEQFNNVSTCCKNKIDMDGILEDTDNLKGTIQTRDTDISSFQYTLDPTDENIEPEIITSEKEPDSNISNSVRQLETLNIEANVNDKHFSEAKREYRNDDDIPPKTVALSKNINVIADMSSEEIIENDCEIQESEAQNPLYVEEKEKVDNTFDVVIDMAHAVFGTLDVDSDESQTVKEKAESYKNTSQQSNDDISETNTTLDKYLKLIQQSDAILKGIQYEDPDEGTCYLIPIVEESSLELTNNDTISDIEENYDDSELELKVLIPDKTYAIKSESDDPKDKGRKSKRLLKRKSDMSDLNIGAKKYRKGKNIDYPKITAVAMSESSYIKEFKRLFDYCSALKFSYSRPFHKLEVNVLKELENWPIKDSPITVSENTNDHVLFVDLDDNSMKYATNNLQQSLADEITADKEPEYPSISINEVNFKMGFGEGSGRVLQNLEEKEFILNCSAVTLSDVKQSQPFLLSGRNDPNPKSTPKDDQADKIRRCLSHIHMREKVRSFFKKSTAELNTNHLKETKKGVMYNDEGDLFADLVRSDYIYPRSTETIVQIVQVGQLPVSAAAQNPVSCDPRVSHVSNVSPPQCSAENSPHDDSQTVIKTEYTELTTADINLPSVQDYVQQNQAQAMVNDANMPMGNEAIPVEEIKTEVKVEITEESSQDMLDNDFLQNQVPTQMTNETVNNGNTYTYDLTGTLPRDTNEPPVPQLLYNVDKAEPNDRYQFTTYIKEEEFSPQQEGTNEGRSPPNQMPSESASRTDQIAYAMSAAGIHMLSDSADNQVHPLINMLAQKMRQGQLNTTQTQGNTYSKTSINATALQQALAQMFPPPLNQTNVGDNNQPTTNVAPQPQVVHIVQGKNANGSQITVVDNSQQSVINATNNTPVLHIVQNKSVINGNATNGGPPTGQTNSFSGLSLVDAGLQQGGNQLVHIVNTGTQKNNATGQLLKRVNLVTNIQGSNEQKMVQFVCKSADGKAIQLNAAQRSMVLRLQPIESHSNVQNPQAKPSELPQNINSTQTIETPMPNKETITSSQQEIKSRSVYEENYAKFIQNTNKPTVPEKSTSLPKFNQAFGKQVYQDSSQKQNDINSNISEGPESAECPQADSINLDHLNHISSPPLLIRKTATPTQGQPGLVQQIKQGIAPMNIQTMHGGVIYTRQIPVNIGGGQTINLITVPSTELVDDSQKHQQSVNQGEVDPPLIKIVPQSQGTPNGDIPPEDIGAHMTVTSENVHNQTQPVLTQMRIKLPMLSKTPQMVSGARVVRPSFFQIQRNVIGGANQPVYQQLVLTAAPPLGQQIRLPQPQTTIRHIKVPVESQSSPESQMSSSTLEQLREFDLVLEQVKERSTVQPNSTTTGSSSFSKQSSDTTDGISSVTTASSPTSLATPTPATSTTSDPQPMFSGSSQPSSSSHGSKKPSTSTTNSSSRSPDSSGIVESPTSSSQPQATTSDGVSNGTANPTPKKKKNRHRSSSHHQSAPVKINPIPPKPSTQKPLEDEQTTQRILYILAEYKEQVENSPDKDKPAPRRRTNPPTNPPGSSKRKKSSRRHSQCMRDMSPVHGEDTCRTMGSEDSSCGTSQGDCSEACMDTVSPHESPRKVVRKLTFEQDTPPPQPKPQPPRNLIVADGQTITVARGPAGKPTATVLMPANYILPMSMVKGGQQIAIVTNRGGGPKLLAVSGEGGTNLLFQRLISPAGLKPMLARPGVRHIRLPAAALQNLQAFNVAPAVQPDSTASPAPGPAPDLVETKPASSPWPEQEPPEDKQDRVESPESEPWHMPSSSDPNEYIYEETVRTENIDRTVLVVHKRDGSSFRHHRFAHVSAAALRHKYAILEHELRLQKSLSEECEDLGVDSPSASELFPEAELLFSSSPAHDQAPEQAQHVHTPQPTILSQAAPPEPLATGALGLEDVGLTVSSDGRATVQPPDREEFARSHPNTTFHSEPSDHEIQPFTIPGLKGRQITSTIFHANRAPPTVLMAAPSVIAAPDGVKCDLDGLVGLPAPALARFDAPAAHRPVIRRVRYEDDARGFLEDYDAKADDGASSPERFWESNSSERTRFSSDSDKCCPSPDHDSDTGVRLDSVIKTLRTYPAKRSHRGAGKTGPEVRRRASPRGQVKRDCHCCGDAAPSRPKKSKKKPTLDFHSA